MQEGPGHGQEDWCKNSAGTMRAAYRSKSRPAQTCFRPRARLSAKGCILQEVQSTAAPHTTPSKGAAASLAAPRWRARASRHDSAHIGAASVVKSGRTVSSVLTTSTQGASCHQMRRSCRTRGPSPGQRPSFRMRVGLSQGASAISAACSREWCEVEVEAGHEKQLAPPRPLAAALPADQG